jgi:hypothetical protein
MLRVFVLWLWYSELTSYWSCSIDQPASSRRLTATAQVRAQSRSMWNLWWINWHWDRFYTSTSVSPVIIPPAIPRSLSSSIIRGWYNWPNSDRSGNTSDLNSVGDHFESTPEHLLTRILHSYHRFLQISPGTAAQLKTASLQILIFYSTVILLSASDSVQHETLNYKTSM